MMVNNTQQCKNCGAPLQAMVANMPVRCSYCGVTNILDLSNDFVSYGTYSNQIDISKLIQERDQLIQERAILTNIVDKEKRTLLDAKEKELKYIQENRGLAEWSSRIALLLIFCGFLSLAVGDAAIPFCGIPFFIIGIIIFIWGLFANKQKENVSSQKKNQIEEKYGRELQLLIGTRNQELLRIDNRIEALNNQIGDT